MKTLKPLISAFFAIVSISFLASETLAQKNLQLPPELSQSSSLSEILNWLDKNGFGAARVGLKSSDDSAVFSQRFRLIKTDGCYLTLRNEDIKLLRFSTAAYPEEYQSLEVFRSKPDDDPTPYPAELYINLNRINPVRGKGPHIHTKDPAKIKLFGLWRTEFMEKRGRSRIQDNLLLVVFDSPPEVGRDDMRGNSITFTFDSKDTSEKFNAAFRQAIKLCNTK
jgi:hypothetical protein